jgi:hypothetical protein
VRAVVLVVVVKGVNPRTGFSLKLDSAKVGKLEASRRCKAAVAP